MKKILNIFAIISLVTAGSSTVVACDDHNNKTLATKQQEENALINFAQQHGIQENEINKSNWSFQDHPAIDEKEEINFTFEELNNFKDRQHSQLLKEFKGKMIYELENKVFSLNDKPFDNPILVPGYWHPSLHKPSTITGNVNDFTIAAGYDDLSNLSDDLSRPDTQTLPKLFAAMDWKNVANFEDKYGKPLLKVPDLQKLQKNYPQAWQLPGEGYMALIHIIKTNSTYRIVWTNLGNDQDKHFLFEPEGDISSVFWKDTNYYHLWCSQQLVQEIKQIYELPTAHYWFQNDNLNKWLLKKSVKPQSQKRAVGVQTINNTFPSYSSYNTSMYMLDEALSNLNSPKFVNWIKSIKSYDYQKYDLAFNNDFSFNSAKSLKATQEFN